MIASPRRQALSLPITRHFEFTRLQNQVIASAYEALVPVVARRPNAERDRPDNHMKTATRTNLSRSSGTGA